MLFNSFEFLLFFPFVTILFFILPHKFRWLLLLTASCVFYMYFVPIYIVILFATIIIDYIAGIYIEKSEGSRRKTFLTMSIIANVGVLAVFKYYNFFIDNINYVFTINHSKFNLPFLAILLPIGLSFHTFQAMSYTIEVYRGNQKAEKNFGIYALYVMFYPQLVAGPIERPQNILHQFYIKQEFNYDHVANGLRQMAWGLFKKVVIADRIAQLIDPVFADPTKFSSLVLCISLFLYAFQIYCDFSGYSDIALGSARVMGYHLMTNFNHPFRSKSITEFWRRWHISLSTWFNDYLFNPMITALRDWGNRAIVVGLLTTFFLSGLWHGAAWKFVIFGIIHGTYVAYEFLTKKRRKKVFNKLPKVLNEKISVVLTFTSAVYAWIFFRANNVNDAFYIARKVPGVFPELGRGIVNYRIITRELLSGINFTSTIVCLLCVIMLELIHKYEGDKKIFELIGNKSKPVRWLAYISCFILITYFGVFDSKQFIYFQF